MPIKVSRASSVPTFPRNRQRARVTQSEGLIQYCAKAGATVAKTAAFALKAGSRWKSQSRSWHEDGRTTRAQNGEDLQLLLWYRLNPAKHTALGGNEISSRRGGIFAFAHLSDRAFRRRRVTVASTDPLA